MSYFLKVAKAEMLKQHKNMFYDKTIYLSLFIWPVLTFIAAYYAYKPFQLSKIVKTVSYVNADNLIVFMLIGYLCLGFFMCLVQSAWRFSFERVQGTLELVYLSPANRLAFILGNALSSLLESVWLFIVFALGIFIFKSSYLNINLPAVLLGLVLMIVMATLWGMFLNSLFLFSRDSGFLYTVLQDPMEFFSGIKIPTAVFPLWAKVVSLIFPLTYTAEVLRRALLNGSSIYELRYFIIISLLLGFIMLGFTLLSLKLGENHAKNTGNMSLF